MQTEVLPKRRFSDLKEIAPEAIARLAADHPAVVEGRTLFPSRVFSADAVPRVLISGVNHRKLGDRVTKGSWRGMPIFALTLEERATCPTSCHHWRSCYGAGMQYARRIEPGPELERAIEHELIDLQARYASGFVVRLHNLGDFYSARYAALWGVWLDRYPALHVFGYTARRDDEIAATLCILTDLAWDRFAIRFSDTEAGPQRACALWSVPDAQPVDGVICPAQTGKTACCGTCGLCWSPAARDKTIYFIAHGARLRGEPASKTMSSVSIREFFATAGSRFTKQDAAVIGPQLQELADSGQATADTIIEIAKSSNSPLHRYFEWDDQKAANQYRLGQADDMSRSIRVRLVTGDDQPANERVTVRVTSDIVPRAATRQIAAQDGQSEGPEARTAQALTDLELWAMRYREYGSMWKRFGEIFEPVFVAIQLARRRLDNPQAASTKGPAPPFKVGELPAAQPKVRYSLSAEFDLPKPVPPAAQRAAQQIAQKTGKPCQIVDGRFRIGGETFTAEQVIAKAAAL